MEIKKDVPTKVFTNTQGAITMMSPLMDPSN